MTTSAVRKVTTESSAIDKTWVRGRLVVYTSGKDAGLMRLDIGQSGFNTRDDLEQAMQLSIPGESSSLSAISAEGEDGQYVLLFFSANIANAGHLPATALAFWRVGTDEKHMKPLTILSVAKVADAANIAVEEDPGRAPVDAYPRTALFTATIVFMVVALFGLAFLLWQ